MRSYITSLVLTHDENGIFGLIPETCRDYAGFDAFTETAGVFHDVFEHWFEGIAPFEVPGSIWAEMVASGYAVYFSDVLSINNFMYRAAGQSRNYTLDTLSQFQELDYCCRYGCKEVVDRCIAEFQYDLTHVVIPAVADPGSVMLRCVISDYKAKVENMHPALLKRTKLISAITSYYRYGYTRAAMIWNSRKLGRVEDHREQLLSFLKTWHDRCKLIETGNSFFIGDEMAYPLRKFTFKVDPRHKKVVKTFLVDEVNNTFDEELLVYY